MSTNMELIETKTVGSAVSSVTFSGIGSTFTDLYVLCSIRGSVDGDTIYVQFNGNTSSYSVRQIYGTGATAASNTPGQTNYGTIGYTTTITASTFGNLFLYVPNYAGSNNKSFSADSVQEANTASTVYSNLVAGLWSNSAAITSLTIGCASGNLETNSTVSLYGISNVTSTTKATGGIVSSDGTYNYHMFPYSGTFTPTESITADVLIIAGGGGGGFDEAGGGGAGGLLQGTISSLTAQAYTVTVGAGGAGGTGGTRPGTNGSNSVFSSHTATGGGGGGGASGTVSERNGKAGGSAGGAASYLAPNTAGTANQGNSSPLTGYGNNGGGATNTSASGGGGGGAGAAGTSGTSSGGNIGKGGNGLNTWSSWAIATQTGADNGYYAGGGGGTSGNTAVLTDGGLGGGGKGGSNAAAATAGTANTGGGGGAGNGAAGGTQNAAAGGSGLVIIRYAI